MNWNIELSYLYRVDKLFKRCIYRQYLDTAKYIKNSFKKTI